MSSIHHNVAMVGQQFSPVCLVACAAMVIQYKRGYTPTAEALGLRGPDFRTPGLTVRREANTEEEQSAWLRRLGFVLARSTQIRDPRTVSMAPSRSGHGVLRSSGPSEELIEWLLRTHGPFILNHNSGAFSYGPRWTALTPPGTGHAVVITGIETNRHRVYFNNPWGDRDVPTTASSIVGAIERWERAGFSSIAYL